MFLLTWNCSTRHWDEQMKLMDLLIIIWRQQQVISSRQQQCYLQQTVFRVFYFQQTDVLSSKTADLLSSSVDSTSAIFRRQKSLLSPVDSSVFIHQQTVQMCCLQQTAVLLSQTTGYAIIDNSFFSRQILCCLQQTSFKGQHFCYLQQITVSYYLQQTVLLSSEDSSTAHDIQETAVLLMPQTAITI